MARTGVRPRLQPALSRECEPASSRAARVQPATISLLQLAQVRRPQSPAIGVLAQRRTPATIARQQYQCDRFLRPQWPIMDSRRTPEPGALPAEYNARHRATGKQLRTRKRQMLLSVQTWTPESRLRRGKKAVLLLDMGSVNPDCSRFGSPEYEVPSWQDRWE